MRKGLPAMGGLVIAWLLGVGTPAAEPCGPALARFQFSQTEMAVPVEIVFYAPDQATATKGAQAAFARIHQLDAILSDYDPESELSRLSHTAGEGKAVAVSEDLWVVLSRAQAISQRSGGAFDVTVGPVVRLWRRARRRKQLPSPKQLQSALSLVDYRLIRLDRPTRSVELLRPGMRLDLGGIAKGYAVGEALATLRSLGISSALVHAGGDLALGDAPPGKPGWRIGIAPLDVDAPPSRYLWLARAAVATSGDAWQYVEIGGRRYSHIVDPHTGVGLTDHSSVTVVAEDSAVADALATAVGVLGPEKGLKLIDDTPGAAALIVRVPQGKVETYQSRRWKELPVAPPANDRKPEVGPLPSSALPCPD